MMPSLEASGLASLAPLTEGISAEYLEHHGVLPIRRDGGTVWVATWHDRIEARVVDDLSLLLDAEITPMHLAEADIRAGIRRTYGGEAGTAEELIDGLVRSVSPLSGSAPSEGALDDLLQQANEGPVIRLVNMLLLEALEARASDVHLEQHASRLEVRYRIDGILQEAPSPPHQLAAAVISRLKIMAELDITERRLPQDGRIRLRLKERDVDVRISTIPVLHGESVVLRLLDTRQVRIRIDDLGMAEDTLCQFREAMRQTSGIVLATGPTGSGKTTTLYGALEFVRTGREKILTVEDPVEYELAGIAQVPVNTRLGLTFARALRALLRQDPDVLLIGEIRDPETAEIAIHAALTGHLVVSTLHTNDAATALTRLLDLGIEPYLVASTVRAVLAQRLVRRVCARCAVERPLRLEERHALCALGSADTPPLPSAVREGSGCDACRGTGFLGRTGMYELLCPTEEIRQEVQRRSGSGPIERVAVADGMRTLLGDGIRLIHEGITTPREVLRVSG